METLKDIFVSYEIAQKLKEIGFDEPCIAIYNQRKEIEIGLNEVVKQVNFVSQDLLLVSDFNGINSHHISSSPFCSAPTYEQALKWFRQRRIYGNINPFLTSLGIEVQDKTKDYHRATFGFATYDQAREKLILKLIEIYKNGKTDI